MRSHLDRALEDRDFDHHTTRRNSQKNKEVWSQGPQWYRHLNPKPFRPNGRTEDKRFSPYSQSVFKYFLKSLSESSIMGINKVASVKNIFNLWILVVVLCMSGFGFQSYQFLKMYSSIPSEVKIHLENDGRAVFPAFTVCSRNR